MLTILKKGNPSRSWATAALVGVACLGFSQMAGAFATPSTATSEGSCVFSQQLQDSVSVRRQYLVKLDSALNRSAVAGNTVEDMYGQIVPASYNGGTTGSLSASFGVSKTVSNRLDVDPLSADCMGCHDGASASAIGIVLRDQPTRHGQVDSFTSDHPIGMTYSSYAAFSGSYKELSNPGKMVFVNGRVGCLTCHDPLNQEKGHLVMSDSKSALCLTCHNK